MRTATIYQSRFLLKELYPAALKSSRSEFVQFHADAINQNCRQLTFDALTVNILRVNDKGLPDGDIVSAVAHVSESVVANYQKHLLLDQFTPITLAQPGTAVFIEAVRPIDHWENTEIYKKHCTPFDFYWVLGVSYIYPFHTTALVAFDYMRSKGDAYCNELSEFEVEYLSYPFYLGWLHQFGAIGPETLRQWLTLLADMPPARFRVIRGLAEPRAFNARTFAQSIGSTQNTVYRHLEHAFEELMVRDSDFIDLDGSINRILALSKAYRFFEFGTASSQRILPTRKPPVG
ncbi:MAG: hypothetical protein ABJM29_17410 [Rhizobiaceae bacterium]